MANFDPISYIGSLVGYPVPKDSIERIARERNVISVADWTEIDRRTRNLVLADILMIIFTSPNNTGNKSRQHGDFSVSIGGVVIYDKQDLYDLMMRLYKNPDLELWDALDGIGQCTFVDIL